MFKKTKFYYRIFLVLVLFLFFAVLGDYWMHEKLEEAKEFLLSLRTQESPEVLIVGVVLYLLILSLPFVPGVEIGLLLMLVFGQNGVIFVYLATVGGLNLAFSFSRLLPEQRINRLMEKCGIPEISHERSEWIEKTLDHSRIGKKLYKRFGIHMWKYRYLALALLFNLPGNYVLGGGGGISFACGASRLFKWRWFVVSVFLATAPVPLLVYFGLMKLDAILGLN